MKRGIVFVLLGSVALVGGCAAPTRIVNQNTADGSVTVAVPDSSDVWPTYYKRNAMEMVQERFGPGYQIAGPGETVTVPSTTNGQNPNTPQAQNPNMPGSTAQKSVTEYRYTFVRVPAGPASANGGRQNTSTNTLMSGNAPVQQAQNSVVPSVQPYPQPVQQVGGLQSRFGN